MKMRGSPEMGRYQMAAALILLSWWTGVDLSGDSQDFLELLRTLTPKLLAMIVALI